MNATETLLERIYQRCEELQWIVEGAEGLKSSEYYRAFPPATTEQIRATEEQLGFPLPAILRDLYLHIANGGIGPGYGIIGALGGFSHNSLGGNLIEVYKEYITNVRLVDYTCYERKTENYRTFDLPAFNENTETVLWSDRLLPLCDWGCAITFHIDRDTGFILRGSPTSNNTYKLRIVAPSLEAWLDQWLRTDFSAEQGERKK